MDFFVIKNVQIVNEGRIQIGDVAMQNGGWSNLVHGNAKRSTPYLRPRTPRSQI